MKGKDYCMLQVKEIFSKMPFHNGRITLVFNFKNIHKYNGFDKQIIFIFSSSNFITLFHTALETHRPETRKVNFLVKLETINFESLCLM